MNDSKLTLLWLTKDENKSLPSLRLRLLKLEPYLQQHYKIIYKKSPNNLIEFLKLEKEIGRAEIVIIQKQLLPPLILILIRNFAKKLYFDFDDFVHIRLAKNGEPEFSRKCLSRFRLTCKLCDAVIAGNNILMKKALDCGAKTVHVVPTAVSLITTERKPLARSNFLNIGWIGSSPNLVYLERIEPVFLELSEKSIDFRLCVMCDSPPEFKKFKNTYFTKWSEEGEADFLDSLDIGLMPLPDNEHTRGKCAYKALQYMSHGIPVILSDVGVNGQWTKGAGFIANNSQEILQAIYSLMNSTELRKTLGARGRHIVNKYFSETVISDILINSLKNAASSSTPFPEELL